MSEASGFTVFYLACFFVYYTIFS